MPQRYRTYGGSAVVPAPFWLRIRAITLYPFRGSAGWTLIALTLCSLLTLIPVIGLVVTIILWIATYTYAFEILRTTANGQLKSPEGGNQLDTGILLRLVLLITLLLVAVVVVLLLTRNLWLTLFALAAVILMQPGCVISLALDRSLWRALNPMVALGLATRIGWPYLAAFGLLFVIQSTAITTQYWIEDYLPPVVDVLAVRLVTTWGLFAIFHLLGYLVYQYHERLGFEPEALSIQTRHDPNQRLLDEAEQQVRDGQLDTAREILRGALRSRAESLQTHELYQRLLLQAGASEELKLHTRQYLTLLLNERQQQRALSVLRAALALDPKLTPTQESQAIQLANHALLSHQFQVHSDLLLAMLHRWPDSPHSPQWALQAAQLLSERFGRDDEARKLLQKIATDTCDDEQRRKIQAAMKALA